MTVENHTIKFDPTASKGEAMTLLIDPRQPGMPFDSVVWQLLDDLSQSRRGILLNKRMGLPHLSIIVIDEEGDPSFYKLPQEIGARFGNIDDVKGLVMLEHFSNALVCLSKDSGSVDIWYPFGVTPTNRNTTMLD